MQNNKKDKNKSSSSVTNKVSYAGTVTAKLVNKNNQVLFKAKNAGLKPLWNAIAKALAGYDVSRDIPKWFSITQLIGARHEPACRRVPFVGTVWGEAVGGEGIDNENSTSVLYTAVLTKADLLYRSLTSNEIKLNMFNANGEALAEILLIEDVDTADIKTVFSNVSPGVDAVVEWRMQISNLVDEHTGE